MKNTIIRSFIAVKIPVEKELETICKKFNQEFRNENIKWVDLTNLHLTLFFLGEVELNTISSLERDLSGILSGFNPFTISLQGLGFFGSRNNPRVVWVGIKPSKQMNDLHEKVIGIVTPYGFQSDERGFNPHITLARIKSMSNPFALNDRLLEYKSFEFQDVEVRNVILFKSELTPRGPIYTPLLKVDLF